MHTENGYTLTAFHVTGSTITGPFTPTKPAVIMQHGMGGNAAVYIAGGFGDGMQWTQYGVMTQLANMGFDVWFANNSGIQYSQVHDVYTVDDEEFWDLDWSKFG